MCIYILLIYSLFDRHLGFFPIVENAAVNNGVQVFVQIYVFIFTGCSLCFNLPNISDGLLLLPLFTQVETDKREVKLLVQSHMA